MPGRQCPSRVVAPRGPVATPLARPPPLPDRTRRPTAAPPLTDRPGTRSVVLRATTASCESPPASADCAPGTRRGRALRAVTVDDLLVSTSGASLRLVILDACRNNPLARSMQRTAATRTVSGGSFADLNEDLLGDETLVAHAAAAGTTAADGRGRNSPYTAALLSHLETPLEICLLFRRVRAQVLAAAVQVGLLHPSPAAGRIVVVRERLGHGDPYRDDGYWRFHTGRSLHMVIIRPSRLKNTYAI